MIDAPLLPLIATLLGCLFSYLGVFTAQRITQQRERIQYRCTKLERGYLLAQMLFDGHRSEIGKLAGVDTMTLAQWLAIRKHPGETMNELKMVVWMYAPRLSATLEKVDTHHQALKKEFWDIDRQVRNRPPVPLAQAQPIATPALMQKVDDQLEDLGRATTLLKQELTQSVQRILRTRVGSLNHG